MRPKFLCGQGAVPRRTVARLFTYSGPMSASSAQGWRSGATIEI